MDVNAKAKKIQLMIFDVDGVLTSGVIYYGNNQIELKGFHIHDGLGIKLLQKNNIEVAIISAKKSAAVERRLQDLNVKHVFLGAEEKLSVYEDLKKTLALTDDVIGYMGDDLPDLAILKRVGLAVTVRSAPEILKTKAHYVTHKKPGKGAVREICEIILTAQNKWENIIKSYDL